MCITKPTKWHVRPAKTQISLGIHQVWTESSLSAWRKLWSLAILWAHSEDSDQTGRMPRLIWVFAGRTCQFVCFVMRRRVNHDMCVNHATRKPVFGACDPLRLKPAYSAAETSLGLEISAIASIGIILSRQWTTKALILLRGCAYADPVFEISTSPIARH